MRPFIKEKKDRNEGFTLVETIFYLVFLLIILGIIIYLVISLTRTYQVIQATKNLESSAVFSLERITRDIRNASSVNLSESLLGTTTGALTVNSFKESGDPEKIKIYLSRVGEPIKIDRDNSYLGPLTLNGVKVNKLEFRYATSSNSNAVKISLGLSSAVGMASTSQNFYSTVVLRDSY